MRAFVRYFAAAVVVCAVSGCGGGHGTASAPLVNASGLQVATPFSATVPIAAGIQSIGISSPLEQGAPEHAIATSGAASACTLQATTKTCTAAFMLPSGAQTLGVAIHAAATTHAALHVTVGSARVALAVGATVAQISLDPPSTQLAGGTAATTTVYVTARDGSGNAIVGDYGTTIALTSSDAAVTLSPSSVTTSGTSVTATYSGSPSVAQSVTLSATAGGLASSAIVNATLGFTATQILFATGGGAYDQILQFPVNASGNAAPMRRTTVTGTSSIYAASPDGKGNLAFCAFHAPLTPVPFGSGQYYGADLATIPLPSADGTVAAHFLGALPAQTLAVDCATDGSTTTYALYSGASSGILAIPSGTSTASRTITGPATGLGTGTAPANFAIGPDGSIAVTKADATGTTAQILVFAPGANGNVAPVRTIAGASTTLSPYGITTIGIEPLAFGPDGSIYVLDVPAGQTSFIGDQRILVFAPGANGNVAPARVVGGALTELTQASGTTFSFSPQNGRQGFGIAVDNAGRAYVLTAVSSAGPQVLRFDAGATGNVAPSNVLGGTLSLLTQSYGLRISGGVVVPAPASGPPSVSGDFLAYAANRGWNYTATPAAPFEGTAQPAFTATLYADPNPANSSVQFALLQIPGIAADATSGILAADVTFNNASGYIATAASSVSNGTHFSVPLPSGLTLVPASLTLGQTFAPYPGITATVTTVGTVPGSSACPSPSTGATVSYVVGASVELVSYVPGCGITDLITDNGTEFMLTSIGSYPQLGTQSVGRTSFAEIARRALSSVWKSVFTPWRAGR